MKKPFITFIVVFAIVFGVLATAGIEKLNKNDAIAKSPAFVLGTPEGITTKSKKGRTSYQINYTYVVAGTTYKLNSDWIHSQAAADAQALLPVQVAYATTAPADAVLKSEFDHRDPGESVMGALIKALIGGIGAALVGTLILVWKFPSLRA